MNQRNLYAFSAVMSCCVHLSLLMPFSDMMLLPVMKEPVQEKVELRLVDSGEVQKEISEVNTPLIGETETKARGEALSEEKGNIPPLDVGERESYEKKDVSPVVKTAKTNMPPEQTLKFKESMQDHVIPLPDDALIPTEEVSADPTQGTNGAHSPVQALQPRLPQEKARLLNKMESEVEDVGDVSYAVKKHEMVPYLKKMRYKIFEEWFSLISLHSGVMPDSRAVIEFNIYQDGTVRNIRATEYQGSVIFSDICSVAIRKAAPFDPPPIEIPSFLREQSIRVRFTFYYD